MATRKRTATPAAPAPALDPTARLSSRVVPGVGPQPARVMIVGEGPGKHEDQQGRPFVGPSGQLLTHILEQKCKPALYRDRCYVTNVIKRRIADDADPTPAEIAYFANTLRGEFYKTQPDVVIAVGRFAARFFLPDCNMELHHGMPMLSEEFGCLVVPCYHPAGAMYDTEMMPALYWDYQRAVACIEGHVGVHYVERRQTRVHDRLPDGLLGGDAPITLGVDTEDLVDGDPWCLTVSWADGDAALLGPGHPDLPVLDAVVRQPHCTTFIHHGLHDLPVLRRLGLDWANLYLWSPGQPRIIDTMQLAFQQGGRIHTQSLKTLVYRLLAVQMDSYDDIVQPVAQERALDYLVSANAIEDWAKPEPEPYWDEEQGKVRIARPQGAGQRLKRIISDYGKYDPAEHEDAAFDAVKRWDALPEHVQAEVQHRLGPFPYTDLSHCPPARARHYAGQDADMTRQLGLELWTRHRSLELTRIADIDHGQIPMIAEMMANGMPASSRYFEGLGAEMRTMQEQAAAELSHLVGRPINPNSSEQLADLLYKELGLAPAKLTRTGRPSTGKKALEHLRKENPFVDLAARSKEFGKIDSSFCTNILRHTRPVIINEDMDVEERAFYELQVTRAKTGRLASKNFNVLAIPVRTELGKRIRHGFRAREGRLLGTWDLNQIEMRVMAHRSRDTAMCEVYNRDPAKHPAWDRDLHIYTASKVTGIKVGPEWKDKSRPDLAKWRTACKSTGFGIIMGITGVGLADQMRMYGLDPAEWTEDRCDELIRDWLKVFGGVHDYQQDMRAQARRTGEVRDMFGRRFLLPHAACPLSWIASEAERQSHALDIQSSAQCIEKLAMREIHVNVLPTIREMDYYCEPIVQIHDELLLEFDAEAAELIDAMMLHTLTTTVQLRVPIEAGGAIGQTWAELEK